MGVREEIAEPLREFGVKMGISGSERGLEIEERI